VEKYASGKSVYNAYNMAGNVSEWVASLYLPYPYNSFDERDESDAAGRRTVRGGSWASSPDEILTFHRISLDPEAVSVYGNDLGFRCASDANQ
jgi:iron(II)-dependent oxidoreductase